MRRVHDPLTLDLFEIPVPRVPMSGALDIGTAVRHLISDLLKVSPRNRFEIAARMSELLGHEITKHQLDSWTAESREGWRFPLEYLPAFEVAVETHQVTTWLADLRRWATEYPQQAAVSRRLRPAASRSACRRRKTGAGNEAVSTHR